MVPSNVGGCLRPVIGSGGSVKGEWSSVASNFPAPKLLLLPIIQRVRTFCTGLHPKAGRGYGGVWVSRGIMRQQCVGHCTGGSRGSGRGYHHPVSIMYILGARAVKGADANEVLFVG